MSMDNIISIVSKVAPLLGAVIGGPIGGLASTAVTLLANSFSANPKDTNDILNKIQSCSDAEIKLKQLEIDHQEFLFKAKNDALESEYKDRASARQLAAAYIERTGHDSYMIIFLTVMLFASIVAGIYCMIVYNSLIGGTMAFMMGTFKEELKSIYAMYFGGVSTSSEDNGVKNVSKH